MAVNTKAIKGRIKSVKNTKKITKAMEMVSAAKMRKATEAVLRTRRYAKIARELLEHLGQIEEVSTPLLEVRPVKKVLTVLISSNRGLCGSFNSNIIKATKKLLDDKENLATRRNGGEHHKDVAENIEIDIIGVGRKSSAFAKKHGYNLVAVFDKLSEKPSMDDVLPIAQMIIEGYKKKEYDKIIVAFTEFQSALVQEPKLRQLLPISTKDLIKMTDQFAEESITKKEEELDISNYLFEPDIDMILEQVLPRLVEIQLYQAILESSASEHSARMVAMKNASESAEDMVKELTRIFNKGRQAAITQEIAEIAGGAAALE